MWGPQDTVHLAREHVWLACRHRLMGLMEGLTDEYLKGLVQHDRTQCTTPYTYALTATAAAGGGNDSIGMVQGWMNTNECVHDVITLRRAVVLYQAKV